MNIEEAIQHAEAGCEMEMIGQQYTGKAIRHGQQCPTKVHRRWVRSRPWRIKEGHLMRLPHAEAGALDKAWWDFHDSYGCDIVAEPEVHRCPRGKDREFPRLQPRWEELSQQCPPECMELGAAETGIHSDKCKWAPNLWRVHNPEEARDYIMRTVLAARQELPPKALAVFRALAETGLAHTTPSIEVLASRAYLAEQTGLNEDEVQGALQLLQRRGYIERVDRDDIQLDVIRQAARGTGKYGRPANVYRILPTPTVYEPAPLPPGKLDQMLEDYIARQGT